MRLALLLIVAAIMGPLVVNGHCCVPSVKVHLTQFIYLIKDRFYIEPNTGR